MTIRPPAEVAPLVAIMGVEATLRLVETHGGTRIKVPAHARPTSALGRVVGFPALRLLVAELGGTHVKVPLCRAWRVKVLRQRDGLSYSEIARALHMTEGTVHRYLADAGMIGQPTLPGL